MKNIIRKVKDSRGYVGIEVVLIASMIIAFGVLTITYFRQTSTDITEDSMKQVNNAIEDMHINTNFH